MALRFLMFAIFALAVAVVLVRYVLAPSEPDRITIEAAYLRPLPSPESAMAVFHLGHSLVGRDMPAMLNQLAPMGHRHDSQLGWGTSLREHWDPDIKINGFETENAHPRYRDAADALASGDYDAVILTEMVELKDALQYYKSPKYLALWANKARAGNPDVRLYLYETWHRLDDPNGWLERIDSDLPALWETELLFRVPDIADAPVYVIPAGQVMARFVRAVDAQGGLERIKDRTDLFARDDQGGVDPIHLNDLGHYLVALTHYAVLYQRSPVGLPHILLRADGSPANTPTLQEAALMQQIVWDVVRGYTKTGIIP